MGIIIRESIKTSFVTIGLSAISAIATLFLYSQDKELYGLFGFIIDTASLLVPLVILGLGQSIIKFFPYRNKSRGDRQNFVIFLAKLFVINLIVFCAFFYFFSEFLTDIKRNPSDRFENYLYLIFPAAISFGISKLAVNYLSNYKNVALPLLIQMSFKLWLPFVFTLVMYGYVEEKIGLQSIICYLLLASLLLLILAFWYLRKSEYFAPQERVVQPSFYSFYFWAFASSIGSVFAFKIDGFMLPTLTDFAQTGEYRIALHITTMIAIPIGSVLSIAKPLIADFFKNNNLDEIKNVYQKGSENLLVIGSFLLICALILIDVVTYYSDNWAEMEYVKYLVLILGFGKLFDMTSSVNGAIIQMSKWYKYNTYFILLLTCTNIMLNIFLIELFRPYKASLIGVALATMISLVIFNVLKTILLYHKFKFHPFNKQVLIFSFSYLLLVVISFAVSSFLALWYSLALNIILVVFLYRYFLFGTKLANDLKVILLRNVGILGK